MTRCLPTVYPEAYLQPPCARGRVVEHALEDEAESLDTLVERATELVPVVGLERVLPAQDSVEYPVLKQREFGLVSVALAREIRCGKRSGVPEDLDRDGIERPFDCFPHCSFMVSQRGVVLMTGMFDYSTMQYPQERRGDDGLDDLYALIFKDESDFRRSDGAIG